MLILKPLTLFALVIALVAATASSASAAAAPDAPWAATGTATAKATSDGTTGNPVLDYSVVGSSGSWTFSATADGAAAEGRLALQGLPRVVPGAGGDRAVRGPGRQGDRDREARERGPVNCCVAPSGGFVYTGTSAFDLQTGTSTASG